MSGFAITPVLSFPAVAGDQLPTYIQFRVNGVNLGGPDVTIVDFVGEGFALARGEGDDENKLTITMTPV